MSDERRRVGHLLNTTEDRGYVSQKYEKDKIRRIAARKRREKVQSKFQEPNFLEEMLARQRPGEEDVTPAETSEKPTSSTHTRPPYKRSDPLAKAKRKAEFKKREKELREKDRLSREEDKAVKKRHRQKSRKRKMSFTTRGQPMMSMMLQDCMDTLKKQEKRGAVRRMRTERK
eukprot:gnl/Dysnectes_brevis/4957_a6911_812.p1 GENE.gnl/Dysnectes_brevis/4957_a6911_812~~gnl/Dysnectes_brevis/4957_a6911_812.p1  ORF type:complete len:173 (-),score=28.91 gnl/Dysnectes_brevis/4957_a6911_812:93-611(-)